MKFIVECLIGQKIAWGKRCLSPFSSACLYGTCLTIDRSTMKQFIEYLPIGSVGACPRFLGFNYAHKGQIYAHKGLHYHGACF